MSHQTGNIQQVLCLHGGKKLITEFFDEILLELLIEFQSEICVKVTIKSAISLLLHILLFSYGLTFVFNTMKVTNMGRILDVAE